MKDHIADLSKMVLAGAIIAAGAGCASVFYPEQIEQQKRAQAERYLARKEGRLVEIQIIDNPYQRARFRR